MWNFIIFILFLIYSNASAYQKCYCGTDKEIHLKPNEITFFESVNFTNVKGNLDYDTIYVANKSVISFITNPHLLKSFTVSMNQNVINWTNIDFASVDPTWAYALDFQGFVIHNELNQNECFLESLCKPFYFEDESQILYIRSSITKINQRKNPCNWNFIAPDGYGFKIVIGEFDVMNDVSFAAVNSSEYYIVNQHSAVINKTYYIEDNHLFIHLSNSNQLYFVRDEFGVYITIVKKKFTIVDANCTVEISDTSVIWTNQNYLNPIGFANNAKCTYELEIFANSMVIAYRTFDYILESADVLSYYDEISNISERFDYFGKGITFFPYKNITTRKILWEFQSDGSTRSGGFLMDFERISCICASPIWTVSCYGGYSIYHLTNTPVQPSTVSDAYCTNMRCNFTIQFDTFCVINNRNRYIQMEIIAYSGQKYQSKMYDYFRLLSDGVQIFYINSSNYDMSEIITIINPNTTNIFEAVTFDADLYLMRTLRVQLIAIFEPIIRSPVYLTKEKPYFFLDASQIPADEVFSIEIEDIPEFENAFIEIYCDQFVPLMSIYKDKNLTILIQTNDCFNDKPVYCKSKSKKLFIKFQRGVYCLYQIVPKALNCLFDVNAFVILQDNVPQPHSFSTITNSNGTCFYFLLVDGMYYSHPGIIYPDYLSEIFTTASKNSVKVYIGGPDQSETLLFQFNNETYHEWQRISLNSPIYIFEIPANSSLLISTNTSKEPVVYDEIQSYEYQTKISPPYFLSVKNFLGFKTPCFSNFTIDENMFVTFNVTYYNVSSFMEFQFFIDGNLQSMMNKVGTIITLTNVSVVMCYATNATSNSNLMINNPGVILQLSIKTNNDSTTPQLTTKSTPLLTTTAILATSSTEKNVAPKKYFSTAICYYCFMIFYCYFSNL